MQFKVPQNIDLEDKIIGPLTMIQFIYVLVGGLTDYLLFQWLATRSMVLFVILALPIGIAALALAFLKIQDQPLAHFVKAGLVYLSQPKVRIWKREGLERKVIYQPPKPETQPQVVLAKKHIEKSQLETLANSLDTEAITPQEEKNFGKVSQIYTNILKNNPQGGGQGGVLGQRATNR